MAAVVSLVLSMLRWIQARVWTLDRLGSFFVVILALRVATGCWSFGGETKAERGPRLVRLVDGMSDRPTLERQLWSEDPVVALDAALGLDQLSTHPFGWDTPEVFEIRVAELIWRVPGSPSACEAVEILARRGAPEAETASDRVFRSQGTKTCLLVAMDVLMKTRRAAALRLLDTWLRTADSDGRRRLKVFYRDHAGAASRLWRGQSVGAAVREELRLLAPGATQIVASD